MPKRKGPRRTKLTAKINSITIDPEKAGLIFIEPLPQNMRKQVSKFEADSHLQVLECANINEAIPAARQIKNCIIVCHASQQDQLVKILTLLKALAEGISQKRTFVFMTVAFKQADVLVQRLKDYGCTEVLVEPVQERVLNFKIDRYTKGLPAYKRKATSKQSAQAKKDSNRDTQGNTKMVPALELESDCWSAHDRVPRRVAGRWMIKLFGPGPNYGRWLEIPSGSKEYQAWQWVPLDAEKDPFITEDGVWVFKGNRLPEYREYLWWFTGISPGLEFFYEKKSYGAKFKLGESGEMHMSEDSAAAKAAEPVIQASWSNLIKRNQLNGEPQSQVEFEAGKGPEGSGAEQKLEGDAPSARVPKPKQKSENRAVKRVEPLTLESDCWLFDKIGSAKFQSGKWTARIRGPSQLHGTWMKAEGNHKGVDEFWQWTSTHTENDPFIKEEGIWLFRGTQPVLVDNAWVFAGVEPKLSFFYGGESYGDKLTTGEDGSLTIARDSAAALAYEELILISLGLKKAGAAAKNENTAADGDEEVPAKNAKPRKKQRAVASDESGDTDSGSDADSDSGPEIESIEESAQGEVTTKPGKKKKKAKPEGSFEQEAEGDELNGTFANETAEGTELSGRFAREEEGGELNGTFAQEEEGAELNGTFAKDEEGGELNGTFAKEEEGAELNGTFAKDEEGGELNGSFAKDEEGAELNGTFAKEEEGGELNGTFAKEEEGGELNGSFEQEEEGDELKGSFKKEKSKELKGKFSKEKSKDLKGRFKKEADAENTHEEAAHEENANEEEADEESAPLDESEGSRKKKGPKKRAKPVVSETESVNPTDLLPEFKDPADEVPEELETEEAAEDKTDGADDESRGQKSAKARTKEPKIAKELKDKASGKELKAGDAIRISLQALKTNPQADVGFWQLVSDEADGKHWFAYIDPQLARAQKAKDVDTLIGWQPYWAYVGLKSPLREKDDWVFLDREPLVYTQFALMPQHLQLFWVPSAAEGAVKDKIKKKYVEELKKETGNEFASDEQMLAELANNPELTPDLVPSDILSQLQGEPAAEDVHDEDDAVAEEKLAFEAKADLLAEQFKGKDPSQPTMGPVSIAFFISELMMREDYALDEIAQTYCRFISSSLSGLAIDLWTVRPNLDGELDINSWTLVSQSAKDTGGLILDFVKAVSDPNEKDAYQEGTRARCAIYDPETQKLMGVIVVRGEGADRVSLHYLRAIGLVSTGILRSYLMEVEARLHGHQEAAA